MISDVPVGVLLSGGVDSTGVLSYAVQQTDKPIHTFTIGFSGAKFADERPYARLASERFAIVSRAQARFAFLKFASDRSAPERLAFLTVAPLRSAEVSLAPGSQASVRSTPERLAPFKSARGNFAPTNLALDKFTPERSTSDRSTSSLTADSSNSRGEIERILNDRIIVREEMQDAAGRIQIKKD